MTVRASLRGWWQKQPVYVAVPVAFAVFCLLGAGVYLLAGAAIVAALVRLAEATIKVLN